MFRLLAAISAFTALAVAQDSIAAKTQGMQRLDGFVPLFWDAKQGKVWLEIARWDSEFLYIVSLPAGLGSNDIGLDRGQLGPRRIVRFERSGPRVLLVQPNYDYRASSENEAEKRSVREAFAESVLWGFDVAAESEGRALVDATSFFLRDAHDVIGALRRTNQGTYRLEPTRSAFYRPNTKGFPRNSEVEVTLTFTTDAPGNFVRQVAPTPESVTIRQRHSFVELPPPGYKPRAFDPRAGYFGIDYADYSTPIGEPMVKRFIARHRLEKRDRTAPASEPVRPIVYYLDPGVPEPVRSALLEGARWWNQAFEAAGFRNAFRVETLPADADPMDIRYNVIQWVHRATRGWSYGSTVIDPRTGEIIKGHVTLGSLRVRQDYLIAEGLLSPYQAGAVTPPEMLNMALARLRQLSAHEVGHTLGLAHNYAASGANRASVMDYPHPLVAMRTDGTADFSKSYAVGIGEWDKAAIQYGYAEFGAGAGETAELNKILDRARQAGLTFITDQDARGPAGAHATASLWDNGADAADELARILRVRRQALARFGENAIRNGAPMSSLEEVLVPLYLSHRYQVEAAAKAVGGMTYSYAVRGLDNTPAAPVSAAVQRKSLEQLLATLDPAALTLPERLLTLIPPRAFGYPRHRETFASRTGVAFDPLAAAEAAAQITVTVLLNPERCARMVQQQARNAQLPGCGEAVDALIGRTWKAKPRSGLEAETQRVISSVVLYHLFAVAANERASTMVRAIAQSKLRDLEQWLGTAAAATPAERAHRAFARDLIRRYREDPKQIPMPRPVDPPPGEPI
jgi:hypothetical protein